MEESKCANQEKNYDQKVSNDFCSKISEEYCSLCRTSHTQGKKHIFTKRHRGTLDKIINKEQEKVLSCQVGASNPTISIEIKERKSWCYFCSLEVQKDLEMDNVAINFLGLAQHLCSDAHQKNIISFCRLNRVTKIIQTKLILDYSYVNSLLTKGTTAGKTFLEKINIEKQKAADTIRKVEEKRDANMSLWNKEQNFVSKSNASFKNFQTDSQNEEPVPPWLMDDVVSVIGPTEKDLNDHQRKQSLDMTEAQSSSSSWMPGFGGVWCKNRRTKKQQFEQKFYSRYQKYNKRQHLNT